MKYFFALVSLLLFFGCSNSNSNLTPVIPTGSDIILDNQLRGIWNLENTDYFRSFSSNGKYASWRMYTSGPSQEYAGDYWVQDEYLITQSYSNDYPDIFLYNISDSSSSTILTLNSGNWIYEENSSSLSNNIEDFYGIWNLENTDYFRSFSAGGKYASWRMYTSGPGQEYVGDFWVQGDYLITQSYSSDYPNVFLYNISNSVLTLNSGNWIKQ
tara:strand:+ start:124 stop:762 length:639 start_codon:yes stop_codon:yes gene_type:complete